ncbi:succinate dehydrogenase assembly factor 2-A, mitochondrial [Hermetia illucens]|nr:succinate dehydrogenase assembly factor 2-A, mitochondrial [Hermetia illucens]
MLRCVSKLRRFSGILTPRAFASTNGGAPPKNPDEKMPPIIDFEDPDYLPLPFYPERQNEPLEQRKQRLLYQSRKRGMLENDLLLSTFAAKYLKSMSSEQTAMYDKLINGPTNDWDIYYWATDAKPTPEDYNNEIMQMFKKHVQNLEKEVRLRMPDVHS